MLQDYIGNIRAAYTKDFTSKDITRQQIAVATYLIDKLALRAGNEKVLPVEAVAHSFLYSLQILHIITDKIVQNSGSQALKHML